MILNGNTIVVTGGGSGIGKALAEAFKNLGNDIIIAGQASNRVRDAAATPGMTHLVLDQDDAASIARFAEAIRADHPVVNVLINNAGIQRVENLKKGEVADADQTFLTNLLGPVRVTAAMMPVLLSQPRATIINITSALAFVPLAATPSYAASKAAFHSYTVSLRYQLRDTPIQVIEVVPPLAQTGLQGEQGHYPDAMPLPDLIAEVMATLKTQPDVEEVVVDRAKPLRFAERDGKFDEVFKSYNEKRSRH